ncbi:MAG: PD-(D/E)XK nuclease-like domain-containing protein [Candidatus Tenebribacter davisii]|nr:PD-(D/E)XK nuclease-like domain-containing protein [Candidatus Tenebribacter davisii]
MKFKDGEHSISIDDYHFSGGISRSSLMLMNKTPYHYWYENESGQAKPRTATPAMILGELVHTLCLEPEFYDDRFAVGPDIKKTTKSGKEAWAEFESELKGRESIKVSEYEKAQAMASSFRSEAVCSSVIQGAKFEKSIFFTHESTGLQCKARPDIWKGSVIGDLKTTEDAGLRQFQNSAHKYGYFIQAGMMKQAIASLGESMEMFAFLCIEKDAPYAVGVYPISAEALDYGSNLFDSLMRKLKECKDCGSWPSYQTEELQLPGYLKESNE